MTFFNRIGDRLLASFGLLVTLLALVALGALIYDVARDGVGRLSWDFLTSYPSRRAEDAGILAALGGSLFVAEPGVSTIGAQEDPVVFGEALRSDVVPARACDG